MKRYLALLAIAAVTLGSIISCDHVENPFPPAFNSELDTTYYPGDWSDYLANEWPDFDALPLDDPNTNALIEDFTGHNCPGCPAAADVAHALHEADLDHVFTAAIHASSVGQSSFQDVNVPLGYLTDFTNQQGLDLGYFFGTTLAGTGFFGNPSGTVNRIKLGSELFYASSNWSTKVSEALATPLKVQIKAKVNYYDATKGLYLHTEIKKLDASLNNEDLSVVVYLIEDTLAAPQNVNGTFTPGYVHRDVMRTTLSGSEWGRSLTSGTLDGDSYKLNYDFAVPNQLAADGSEGMHNAGNMHLLIYVYDVSTYEIYQVIKKKL